MIRAIPRTIATTLDNMDGWVPECTRLGQVAVRYDKVGVITRDLTTQSGKPQVRNKYAIHAYTHGPVTGSVPSVKPLKYDVAPYWLS